MLQQAKQEIYSNSTTIQDTYPTKPQLRITNVTRKKRPNSTHQKKSGRVSQRSNPVSQKNIIVHVLPTSKIYNKIEKFYPLHKKAAEI